jgi:tetratricopeptide (TPR) repeat protein
VTTNVISAIAPRLEQAEIERARRKPTESLDAYDYYLRGLAEFHRWTRKANQEALAMFKRAIELDPDFASAYGLAARCYSQRRSYGWMGDPARETADAEQLIRQVKKLGGGDAVALCSAGFVLGHLIGKIEDGDAMIDRALVLNPNLAIAWLFSGWTKVWLGESELAIERAARAMRLSPQDPNRCSMMAATAYAHFLAGRDSEALSWAERAIQEQPDYLPVPTRILAASSAFAGRQTEAQAAVARLREIDPTLRISNLADRVPLRRPEHRARLAEGLRKAGLPE